MFSCAAVSTVIPFDNHPQLLVSAGMPSAARYARRAAARCRRPEAIGRCIGDAVRRRRAESDDALVSAASEQIVSDAFAADAVR